MEQILGNEKQFSNRILDRDDVHRSLCPPQLAPLGFGPKVQGSTCGQPGLLLP